MSNFPFNIHHLPPEFSITGTKPCGYLPHKEEQLIFIDTSRIIPPLNINDLNSAGFRRIRNIFYKNACSKCTECQPLRIMVNDFQPSKNMLRIAQKNHDLTGKVIQNFESGEEHYQLMKQYLQSRHESLDASLTANDFKNLIGLKLPENFTIIKEWRLYGQLLCYVILDKFNDGLSAVYSCFDPQHEKRSLGHYMILETIQMAKSLEYDYVYLGFYVKNSNKMEYKSRYKPYQILTPYGWQKKL